MLVANDLAAGELVALDGIDHGAKVAFFAMSRIERQTPTLDRFIELAQTNFKAASQPFSASGATA